MSLDKTALENSGWTFTESVKTWEVQQTAPVYDASRAWNDTRVLKTSEDEDALLADINAWEDSQKAAAEAAVVPEEAPAVPAPTN